MSSARIPSHHRGPHALARGSLVPPPPPRRPPTLRPPRDPPYEKPAIKPPTTPASDAHAYMVTHMLSPKAVETHMLAVHPPMNTMEGASSSATRNSSRTSLGPSPRYFWMSSLPTTRRNVALVELATALASRVLPVPGSP